MGFPASDPASAGRRCHRYAVGRKRGRSNVTSNSNYKTMQTKTKEETKQDAIREWVAREFNAVPQEWVRIAMEHFGYCEPLPMWGTMWMVDARLGEKFMQHARVMAGDASEIDIERIGDAKKRGKVQNAITGLKEENID